ncbi:MAG: hypothetical protein JWM76_1578, partial [Pseudonocardiales bacterium]|nr:hypothetical protein [Pseudonocardiales bacterium]
TGPCQAQYRATVTESATAIIAKIIATATPHTAIPGQSEGCDLAGHGHTIQITLAQPLGNRVLIDDTGRPLALE